MSGLYQRGHSPYWWCWYKEGKKVKRVSTKKKLKRDAKEVLRQLEESSRKYERYKDHPDYRETKISDILQLYVDDYAREIPDRINSDEYIKRAGYTENILAFFMDKYGMDIPVINITAEIVDGYIDWRRTRNHKNTLSSVKEVKNATINRDLSCLRRAFQLGFEHRLVLTIPHIRKLPERNIRTGVFDIDDILLLDEHLPDYLSLPVWFAFLSSWRKTEVFSLLWRNINLRDGSVFIEPDRTKNQDGKTYYFDKLLKQRFLQHHYEMQQIDMVSPTDYVFLNKSRTGKINDFRKPWKKALIDAGLPKTMLFHDLRRSGIINMVNSGVPYNVVMKVSGHKTRAVFDRYFITPEDELKGVSQKVADYLDRKIEK